MEVIAMSEPAKRSTVYLDPALHRALRIKAVHTHRSMSDLVNDAVRMAFQEDREDLAAFEERAEEPTISYEELLKDLRAHGKI
jgi:plasmid stability protein